MQDMSKIKKELLEMLKKEMKEMMYEGKKEYMDDLMPKPEMDEMSKVTVAGDSPEALEEGLSKAQEIMKAKMAMYDQEDKKSKKKKY